MEPSVSNPLMDHGNADLQYRSRLFGSNQVRLRRTLLAPTAPGAHRSQRREFLALHDNFRRRSGAFRSHRVFRFCHDRRPRFRVRASAIASPFDLP